MFKKIDKLLPDQILDSQISDELVKEIILNGDSDQLVLLSKNPKFSEYDPEFFIGLAKIQYKWSQNIQLQLILFGSLLVICFLLKVWAFINLCIFGYIVYIYLYKVSSFEELVAKDERARIDYIKQALKDTPYDISSKTN